MIKYATRILAAVYVLAWMVWGTTVIGETPKSEPITWIGVWAFVLAIATGVWLGWQARGEANEK